MHGPDELGGPRSPAHAPRDRELVERGLHDAGQQLCGLFAGARRPAEQELALVVVEARELIDLHAAGVGKSVRGARRLAGGVERGRDRRAAALDPLLRLAVEQLRDLHREAPRREIRERRAVREAGGIQASDDAVAERFAEGDEALRRHFLRADLDQEVVAVHFFFIRTVASEPVSEGTVPPRSSGKPFASRLAK